MQAQASDSKLIFYWVSSTRDYAGAGYPGTGTPEEVAVAAFQPADVSGVVDSFNGRTGAVLPESGDYSAAEVSFDDSTNDLTSTDVQGAIEELAAPSGIETIPDGYSITTADAGAFLVYDSASDGNYSFPASLLPGQSLEIQQKGAGSIAPVGLPGQTFNSPRFTGQFPRTSGPGAVVKIRCTATDEYSFTGDLREEKPILKYRLDQTPTADFAEFEISNVVAQGGFSSSFTTTNFAVPISGQYVITFNASLGWSDTGDEEFMTIQILRKNLASAGYSKIGEQQLYKPTSSAASAELPINYSLVASFAAGQEFRIIPSSTGGTCTPDINSNERNECNIQWISD